MSEQPSKPSPEIRQPDEAPNLTMTYLAEHLRFEETPEMVFARGALVEAMVSDSPHVRALAEEYQLRGEAVVENHSDSEAKNAARVALNIAMALIRLEAGRTEDGVDDLYLILDDLDGLVTSGRDEFIAIIELVEATIESQPTVDES